MLHPCPLCLFPTQSPGDPGVEPGRDDIGAVYPFSSGPRPLGGACHQHSTDSSGSSGSRAGTVREGFLEEVGFVLIGMGSQGGDGQSIVSKFEQHAGKASSELDRRF